MKKALYVITIVFIAGFAAIFNYQKSRVDRNNVQGNVMLKNVSAMQASAFETICQATDPDQCKIEIVGGPTGYSYGPAITILH